MTDFREWTQEALDEAVHEAKASEAADINNSGREEQAAYLNGVVEPRVTGNPKAICITMDGGLIQYIENIPPGVRVEVWDFDTDGADPDDLHFTEGGDYYYRSVWEGGALEEMPAMTLGEEEDRCPHGMFWTGAGACPACEGSS